MIEATNLECFIMAICGDVAELPDRTSPEDQPDMMLVSFEELQIILSDRISPFIASARAEGYAEAKRDVDAWLRDEGARSSLFRSKPYRLAGELAKRKLNR